MKARTRAVVAPGGVLAEVACEPPLTLRQVRAEAAGTCALCLVGTAAGPLPGDDLELELRVEAGARASLQATGASLAQGHGAPARLTIRVVVGPGAQLVADPGPLIAAAGARVAVVVRLDLAADAVVSWRETVVLGRTGEAPGAATIRWDVTRAGRPVLRQLVDLTDPDALAGHRVLSSQLLVDGQGGQPRVDSPTAVGQVLADGSRLATVLADDAARAAAELDRLVTEAQPAPLR